MLAYFSATVCLPPLPVGCSPLLLLACAQLCMGPRVLLSVPAAEPLRPAVLGPWLWLLLGTRASGIEPTGVRMLAAEDPAAPAGACRCSWLLPLLPPMLWDFLFVPRMPSTREASGGMARKLRMVDEEEALSPLEARVPKPPWCGWMGEGGGYSSKAGTTWGKGASDRRQVSAAGVVWWWCLISIVHWQAQDAEHSPDTLALLASFHLLARC